PPTPPALPYTTLFRSSYSEETRNQLHEELEKAFGVVKALGGDYKLEFFRGYDATYNDPAVAKLIENITADMLGEDKLEEPEAGRSEEHTSELQSREKL